MSHDICHMTDKSLAANTAKWKVLSVCNMIKESLVSQDWKKHFKLKYFLHHYTHENSFRPKSSFKYPSFKKEKKLSFIFIEGCCQGQPITKQKHDSLELTLTLSVRCIHYPHVRRHPGKDSCRRFWSLSSEGGSTHRRTGQGLLHRTRRRTVLRWFGSWDDTVENTACTFNWVSVILGSRDQCKLGVLHVDWWGRGSYHSVVGMG